MVIQNVPWLVYCIVLVCGWKVVCCNAAINGEIVARSPLLDDAIQTPIGSHAVDSGLYSRQLLVLGASAQLSLQGAHVLVIGNSSLFCEVAKNLALAGVGKLSFAEYDLLKERTCSSLILCNETISSYIKSLNAGVQVAIASGPINCKLLQSQGVTAVVAADEDLIDLSRLDAFCRDSRISLIAGSVTGLSGFIFNDFQPNFEYVDADGEDAKAVLLSSKWQAVAGSERPGEAQIELGTIEEEVHGLGLGDVVEIVTHGQPASSRCRGTVAQVLDTKRCVVRLSPEDALVAGEWIKTGTAAIRKVPRTLTASHQSLALQLLRPSFCPANECLPPKRDRAQSLCVLACLKVSAQLREAGGKMIDGPREDQMAYYRILVVEELKNMGVETPELSLKNKGSVGADVIDAVLAGCYDDLHGSLVPAQCPATVSVIGAMMAQEVIKAVTHLHAPISQFFVHSGLHTLRDGSSLQGSKPPQIRRAPTHKARKGQDCRILRERVELPYPREVVRELRGLRVFVVGAGAIGCELLKNFALMGVGTGPDEASPTAQALHAKSISKPRRDRTGAGRRSMWERRALLTGGIVVSDMDVIERSNLNRQLLFREKHIGLSKAQVAAQEVCSLNPALRGHVVGLTLKVAPDTEDAFNHAFWRDADVVVTALDNAEARRYVDEQCVAHGKWLIDSGTLGTKGNTQVVIPHLTESYSSSADPEEAAIPLCTIKTFPYQPEHCVAWAKSKFEEYFSAQPRLLQQLQSVLRDAEQCDVSKVEAWLATLSNEQIEDLKACLQHVPWDNSTAVQWAEDQLIRLFDTEVKALLQQHPPEEVDEDGQLFWGGSRRLPRQIPYDPQDALHRAFVTKLAQVRTRVLGSGDAPVHSAAAQDSAMESQETGHASILRTIAVHYEYWKSVTFRPEEFEKNAAELGHVGVIAALTNLRSRAYSIPEIDDLQVQKVAGNIIPALATTTSVVAGLVAQEVVKLAAERARYRRDQEQQLQRRKRRHQRESSTVSALATRWLKTLRPNTREETKRPSTTKRMLLGKYYLLHHKDRILRTFTNSFVNLARPMLAFAQTQEAEEFVFSGRRWTLWDTIEMPGSLRSTRLGDLIEYLQSEYGTALETVTWGDTLLYARFVPEHERLLDAPLLEVMLRALAADRPPPEALVALQTRLKGKAFVLLEGSGSAGTSELRVPPIKLRVKE